MKPLLLFLVASLVAFGTLAQNPKTKNSSKSKVAGVKPETAKTPAVTFEKAEIKFDTLAHDFKEVFEGKDAIYVFKFYNIGKEPLIVSGASPSCSCTIPDYTKEPVMPGKSGVITVKYPTSGRMGAFVKTVTVTSNSGSSSVQTLTISGTVIAAPQEVH
jgi:hypothetical protein